MRAPFLQAHPRIVRPALDPWGAVREDGGRRVASAFLGEDGHQLPGVPGWKGSF